MRFWTRLLSVILLVCPCALCYGQTSFSSVNGEGGYASLRGSYTWKSDGGLILIPAVGYYRPSDHEEDEVRSITKVALESAYEIGNDWTVFGGGYFIARRMGYQSVGYYAGGKYNLCYYCGWLKNPYIKMWAGQNFYDITMYANQTEYPGGFTSNAPFISAEAGSELYKFFLQARYDKVIKYSHRPPANIAATWTEIPFMTAVMNGFVSDIVAAKATYRTRWITPYVVYARYTYLTDHKHMGALAGGLALRIGSTVLSGGIEVFEPKQTDKRRSYFSVSASSEF